MIYFSFSFQSNGGTAKLILKEDCLRCLKLYFSMSVKNEELGIFNLLVMRFRKRHMNALEITLFCFEIYIDLNAFV